METWKLPDRLGNRTGNTMETGMETGWVWPGNENTPKMPFFVSMILVLVSSQPNFIESISSVKTRQRWALPEEAALLVNLNSCTIMIPATGGKLHWNYLIALDRDLEIASRYVEFCEPNYKVFSIEFAHLLFAAASEVDVLAKMVCRRFQPSARLENINDYRAVLLPQFPALPTTQVFIPRFGLTLTPWSNWSGPDNPEWWGHYNKVKHQRDVHFNKATLKNALNALGGLLILTVHHYSYEMAVTGSCLKWIETTDRLRPETTLLRLAGEHYSEVVHWAHEAHSCSVPEALS